MYYRDVTHGISPSYQKALEDEKFKNAYFVNEHFIMFELGYTPLTFLAADYDDFRKARRRYHAMTEIIDFAIIRLESLLIPDAKERHKEYMRHRRFVLAQIMMIDKNNFIEMRKSSTFQTFMVSSCRRQGVDPINVALLTLEPSDQLRKLVLEVGNHSELDEVLFKALCPSKV